MLDSQIRDQLKEVFQPLENSIEMVFEHSAHSSQSELMELLGDVASTHPKLSLRPAQRGLDTQVPVPQFRIDRNGSATGISFVGIPNGHEFSSLILALLNADGKGRQPDPGLAARIKRLKGPIHLKTYISLTCENCPDVVQALNLMALNHSSFTHQMIDGAFVQDEVKALGIQGVPSVVSNGKLIHSGKIEMLDLVAKLESVFGVETGEGAQAEASASLDLGAFDVVVVGGGPAGASAAIYSARKGLKTALLAERVGGQVRETKGIENLISVKYTEGPQLAAQLMEHVMSYPVTLFEHRRVNRIELSPTRVHLEGGESLTGKSLIIATGAKWRELGVPGEKEYIGRGVAFCPHCDGPFYQGKKVAVIGGGNSGVEAALDLSGIVKEVVLIEYANTFKADQVLIDQVKKRSNISMISGAQTKQILGNGTKVEALEYIQRATQEIHKIELDGVFVQIGLLPNSQFLKGVVELTKFGEVVIDSKGRTSVPGIYAAGDVTTVPYKQIIIAMGEGAKAALAAFEDGLATRH